MNRLWIILVISSVCFSCNNKVEVDPKIKEFEDFLGPKMTEAIDYSVDYLDSIVLSITKENNIDSAYKKFFIKLSDYKFDWISYRDSAFHFNELINKGNFLYIHNELYLKLVDLKIEDGNFIAVFGMGNDTMDYINKEFPHREIRLNPSDTVLDRDSIVKKYRLSWLCNSEFSFIKALEAINDSSKSISDYLEMKDQLGSVSQTSMANGILESKPDLSNYFEKRMIAMELLFYYKN